MARVRNLGYALMVPLGYKLVLTDLLGHSVYSSVELIYNALEYRNVVMLDAQLHARHQEDTEARDSKAMAFRVLEGSSLVVLLVLDSIMASK